MEQWQIEVAERLARIEANQEAVTDHDLTNLKKQRRRVKDMLYNQVLQTKEVV